MDCDELGTIGARLTVDTEIGRFLTPITFSSILLFSSRSCLRMSNYLSMCLTVFYYYFPRQYRAEFSSKCVL